MQDDINIPSNQFTNSASTVNTAQAIANAGSVAIGVSAATTVDVDTAFILTQTTAGTTKTLHTPTNTTAGRLVYVTNSPSSTTTFTLYSVVIPVGGTQGYIWNGSAWTALNVAGAGSGVSTVGAIDSQTKSLDGAVISGSTIYFQTADGTNPGLVSTGIQTFAGAKTLSGATTFSAAGTAVSVTNDVSVGGAVTTVDLNVSGLTTLTGNLLANNSATGVTGTTSGTGTNTTTLVLSADAFAVNDVVLIDNVGQDYYTRVTVDPGTGSYTVSPAVTFENARTVTKYNIQNVGATATDYTTRTNRFFQGYFLGGITVGAGSTTLADGVLERTTGDIVINPGAGGVVNVNGTLNATTITGDGSNITNIDGSSVDGATVTGIDAGNISTGTLNDGRLSSNVALLNGAQSFSALQTFAAGVLISSGQTLTVNGEGFSDITGTGLSFNAGSLEVVLGTTVDGTEIVDASVALDDLADNSVNSAKIVDGSVTGTDVANGTIANTNLVNSGITITAGTGLSGGGSVSLGASTSISVAYGSATGTAVEGNTTITCPSGTGNLTGGGNTITLGAGGSCGALNTSNAVTFSTSTTSPLFTGTGSVTLSSGGTGDLTLDSASNVLIMSDATWRRVATGATTLELNDSANTSFAITNTDGVGVANLSVEGAVTATSFNGSGASLTSLNATNISSGTLADARLSSNVALLTGTQTFSGAKTFSAGATITSGQTLTIGGKGFTDLQGTGLTLSSGVLSVAYGSAAGTAVEGNTQLTCASGSGNLTGGGNAVTLGTGGSCNSISTNNAVAFTTSVTSPLLTASGALELRSGGANTLTIDAGGAAGVTIAGTNANSLALGRSGIDVTINGSTLVLGTSTIRRTAAGITNFELNDGANTTLNITNTDGSATANVTVEGDITATNVSGAGAGLTALNATNVASGTLGDARLSANVTRLDTSQTFSAGQSFSAGLTISSGQAISINGESFSDLTGTGLVLSGSALAIDTTYFNANYLQLGSASIQTDATNNSTIGVNKTSATGNLITLQRSGVAAFTVANTGALQIRATSTTGLDIQTGGGVSTFSVDTTGNIVRVGQTTADTTGVLFVLDTKTSNGDPAGENGAQYFNSARGTFRCYENGRGWTDCLGVAKPNTRRSTEFLANGTSTTLTSDGGDIATVTGTGSAAAATTTTPAAVNYATANGGNNDAGIVGNTNYNTSSNPSMQANIRLVSTASTRNWAGFTNQTLATMNGAANPAGIYAAFRYDTSALDTNWQCITKNGGAQAIANSGVAASTNEVEMEIIIVGTTRVEFKIDGVLVCTSTTNLPAANTMMRYDVSRRNLVAGAQSIQVAWLYIDSDQ